MRYNRIRKNNINMTEKKYMNVDEASDYLRISKATLYKITSEKRIKFYRPGGGKLMFQKEDLDEYVKSGLAA